MHSCLYPFIDSLHETREELQDTNPAIWAQTHFSCKGAPAQGMRSPHFRSHLQSVHWFSIQFHLFFRNLCFSAHFNRFPTLVHWFPIPFHWFSARVARGAPRHQASHLSSNSFSLRGCTCAGYARSTFLKMFTAGTLIFYAISTILYTFSMISTSYPLT